MQGNALLLDALVSAVCDAAVPRDVARRATLLELFAGAGFLTLPLARSFARTLAVEASPQAARDLRTNLRAAGLEKEVEVVEGRAEAALHDLGGLRPDTIVLDPPRSGLTRAALLMLSDLGAQRVVYLSCDPATLARDLAVLAERGHHLIRVEGFYLFPQTPHVEALAVMERP